MRSSGENKRQEKNASRKSTYPPPADGLCVPFFCKDQSGATTGSAQACCGGCGRCRDCTQCKVLQKSAEALHTVTERRRVGLGSETPGVQGLRPGKPTAQGVFVF